MAVRDDEAQEVLVALLAIVDPDRAPRWAGSILDHHASLNAALVAREATLLPLVDGEAKAVALLAAHRRAALFLLREKVAAGPIVATRHELIDYCRQLMAHERDEQVRVFFLNGRRELLAEEVIARGGPEGVTVRPRQILARALEIGACGMVLVHNHPSGDPAPSDLDRRFTRKLAVAAETLGLRLHDHLIVARGGQHCIAID